MTRKAVFDVGGRLDYRSALNHISGCHGCDGAALFSAYFRRFSLFNPASERPSRRSES